jgi:hypothetical protein
MSERVRNGNPGGQLICKESMNYGAYFGTMEYGLGAPKHMREQKILLRQGVQEVDGASGQINQ